MDRKDKFKQVEEGTEVEKVALSEPGGLKARKKRRGAWKAWQRTEGYIYVPK